MPKIACKCARSRPLPAFLYGELTVYFLQMENETLITNTEVTLEAKLTSGAYFQVTTTTDGQGHAVFSISEEKARILEAEALKLCGHPVNFKIWYDFSVSNQKEALIKDVNSVLYACVDIDLNPAICDPTPGGWLLKLATPVECTEKADCTCVDCSTILA